MKQPDLETSIWPKRIRRLGLTGFAGSSALVVAGVVSKNPEISLGGLQGMQASAAGIIGAEVAEFVLAQASNDES